MGWCITSQPRAKSVGWRREVEEVAVGRARSSHSLTHSLSTKIDYLSTSRVSVCIHSVARYSGAKSTGLILSPKCPPIFTATVFL